MEDSGNGQENPFRGLPKRLIEKHEKETGTTLEAVATGVLVKNCVKQISYMNDSARGVLKILAKSKNYVSRALLLRSLT